MTARDGASAPAVLRLGREAWFERLGELALSIGTDGFHQRLVELFGAVIRNEGCWIIRYSRVAPPDVIYTSNVPQEVVDYYVATCSELDPFSAHWKRHEEPGVRTLAGFYRDGAAVDPEPYGELFRAAAKVSDELGIFFSTVGHSSLGLFLERTRGHFTPAEVARARLVFPVLDGFHATHVGRLFDRLRYAGDPSASELVSRPTLVQDRHGLEIFATPSWREAAAADPSLVEAVRRAGHERSIDLVGGALKIERFDERFPLAPSGRMFVLAPRETAAPPAAVGNGELHGALTAREREVFDLIMAGCVTGAIAQNLRISKGTVKNCRLRIYRKAGVSSERALVRKFTRGGGEDARAADA